MTREELFDYVLDHPGHRDLWAIEQYPLGDWYCHLIYSFDGERVQVIDILYWDDGSNISDRIPTADELRQMTSRLDKDSDTWDQHEIDRLDSWDYSEDYVMDCLRGS